ncbi:MAG TPA: hypothetical protein VF761_16865 [Gemmatimonadaceae bacterium]
MIRSRDYDRRNGFEPGEPRYDVRHGTHLVDPKAERYGYGDREWIGMTDGDRLLGRACVWTDGLSVCAGERDAWVWRKLEHEQFDDIGEPRTSEFFSTLWRAYFTCGCESLRYRMHPPEEWPALNDLMGGRSTAVPRGFIRRTVLSGPCALHRAMRDEWSRHWARIRQNHEKRFALALYLTQPILREVFGMKEPEDVEPYIRGPWPPFDPEDDAEPEEARP